MSGFDPDLARAALAKEQQASLAPVARVVSSGPTADQEAATRRLAASTGLQPDTVRRRPDEAKALNLQKTFESASPMLRAALRNVDFARLAQDDLPNLAWYQSPAAGFKTGVIGAKQMGESILAMPKMGNYKINLGLSGIYTAIEDAGGSADLADLGIENEMSLEASYAKGYLEATPEERQEMRAAAVSAIARDKDALTELQGKFAEYAAEMEQIGGDVPDFTDIRSAKGFSDWLMFNTGQAIPYMAITALAGVATGGVGVAAAGYGMGVGDIAGELISEGEFEGNNSAFLGAVPYAALEFLGPAAKPFRGVGGDLLESVAEGYFRRIGKELPENIVEEFINEAGQEIIKDYAVADATGDGVVLDGEKLLAWFNAGMAGAAGGAGMSTGSSVYIEARARRSERVITRAQQRATAEATASRLEQISGMATQSKLRENDPKMFKEYVESAGLTAEIAVPASEVDTFYQGEVPDQVLEQMGVERSDFEAMLGTGGSIDVSEASFAAYFAGTDAEAVFTEHGSFQPGAMSRSEGRAFDEGVGQEVANALEETFADVPTEVTAADELQSTITEGILSSERTATPTEARAQASVVSNIFSSIAERTGTTVGALSSKFGLDVRGTSDVPQGVVADEGVADQPAAQPSPPLTPEQEVERVTTIFEQAGALDTEVTVDMDDGTTEAMPAGQIKEALEARRDKANSLLECLRYG